jgi:hypothetical protein
MFLAVTSSTRRSAIESLACILEVGSSRAPFGQWQRSIPGTGVKAVCGSAPPRALPAPWRVSTTAVDTDAASASLGEGLGEWWVRLGGVGHQQ